jgi:hypothetical protein
MSRSGGLIELSFTQIETILRFHKPPTIMIDANENVRGRTPRVMQVLAKAGWQMAAVDRKPKWFDPFSSVPVSGRQLCVRLASIALAGIGGVLSEERMAAFASHPR